MRGVNAVGGVNIESARDQIRKYDSIIQAWTHVSEPFSHHGSWRFRNGLPDWPVGIKDVIDVSGIPTNAGAFQPHNRPAEKDALLVKRLRKAGASILGKTATTEYASIGPVPSRNPRDITRSAGGSSSGSAAAVAAGMCRVAVGTQTAGSVIRPASYTGVFAIKPTLGSVELTGVLPVAPSIDTVGLFAGNVDDIAQTLGFVASDEALRRWASRASYPNSGQWRVAVADHYFEPLVEPEVRDAFRRALNRATGLQIEVEPFPREFDWHRANQIQRCIMLRETWCSRSSQLEAEPSHFSPGAIESILRGRSITDSQYHGALASLGGIRDEFAEKMSGFHAILAPAATSVAPCGEISGDYSCNAVFTLLGSPVMNIPVERGGSRNLPIGLQIATTAWNDPLLISLAAKLSLLVDF